MASSLLSREDYVQAAKVAKQAKCYDEVSEWMTRVAKLNVDFTEEERSLFQFGYKSKIALLRMESPKEEKIESEICNICTKTIATIDDHLIPSSFEIESFVFCHRIKGDCYRYVAELKTGSERKEAARLSLKAYMTATGFAEDAGLSISSCERLGVALNMSKLLYEIIGDETSAILHSDTAYYEAALEVVEGTNSYTIWEMLRENVKIWAQNRILDLAPVGAEADLLKLHLLRARKSLV